jgi:IMP cyclohydrolase
VVDSTVVITNGRETAEASIKVEEGAGKFSRTSVRYTKDGEKMKIREIRIGGTTTKLVFN